MLRAFTRSFTSTIPKKNFANGQLFGRVGNVDFKESANGTKYVRYSLAVNKFRKGEDSITDWYNITIFDEGELQKAEKALRVGNKMIVDVTLRLDKFEDPETKKFKPELLSFKNMQRLCNGVKEQMRIEPKLQNN